MIIKSKVYLGIPPTPDELLDNGDFELVTGDDFDDWTETTAAGSEKLSNGDFELVTGDDFDDWQEFEFGTGSVEDEGAEVHGGSHSVKIVGADWSGGNYGVIYRTFACTSGKSYTLKVWVKGDYFVSLDNSTNADQAYGTVADWTQIQVSLVMNSASGSLYIRADDGTVYVDDASLLEDYAGVEDEGTTVHGGSHAVKIAGDGTIEQTGTTTAETREALTFWSKGNGDDGLKYIIYDVTGSVEITSGNAPISTDWQKSTIQFYTPASCVSVKVTFDADGYGVFYLDDVEFLQYGAPIFVDKTADVMSEPPLQWGYGIKGTDPLRNVANTGISQIPFDNSGKEYSPEGGSRIVGFEEGMDVKITTSLDADISIGDAGLLNGSFE